MVCLTPLNTSRLPSTLQPMPTTLGSASGLKFELFSRYGLIGAFLTTKSSSLLRGTKAFPVVSSPPLGGRGVLFCSVWLVLESGCSTTSIRSLYDLLSWYSEYLQILMVTGIRRPYERHTIMPSAANRARKWRTFGTVQVHFWAR